MDQVRTAQNKTVRQIYRETKPARAMGMTPPSSNSDKPTQPVNLFGVVFTPIRLLHGRLPIVGFRIEGSGSIAGSTASPTIAYCTDVSSIPPESWPKLENLDVLVLDMLRFRHHPTHLNLDQALEIAHQVGAKQTYFTHMTHCVSHAKTDAELPENTHLAHDGLRL